MESEQFLLINPNWISSCIQSRFLGAYQFTARLAVEGDMGWKSCLVEQRCGTERLLNCFVQLPEEGPKDQKDLQLAGQHNIFCLLVI